ncbi:MAG: cytochrome c [Anaerolineae bacterium]|nr:cytochrome c [Anaerolineae bacterium]NUQ02278.1 c-type cytochrome [Anaerolineae bacterium]
MQNPKPVAVTAPVIIAVVLLLTAAVAFFVTLLIFSPSNPTEQATNRLADDYAAVTDRLLAIGDASRAEPLLEKYACAACHLLGGERVAPPWEEVPGVAADRRPPLTAAEYVYESIIHPGAYLVEGYPPSMPQDYASRMSEQEIADVLAYLLHSEP